MHEFGVVQALRTSSNLLEPQQGSSKAVGRACSVQANHPEHLLKNSTHLARAALLWFEKVRGGSKRLNYPELVHKHPAHLASPVKL